MIVSDRIKQQDSLHEAVRIMLLNAHSVVYSESHYLSGQIEVLPLRSADRHSVKYTWNVATRKYDLETTPHA